MLRALKDSNVSDECCHLRSAENSIRESLRTRRLGKSWILTGDALTRTRPMQSGDTFILLIVMAQSGTRNAVMYIYASTYVRTYSFSSTVRESSLTIHNVTGFDGPVSPSEPIRFRIDKLILRQRVSNEFAWRTKAVIAAFRR